MTRMLAIALGGVIGSLARFAIARLFDDWNASALPVATLTANILGCLAIGAIAASASIAAGPSWLRPFLITGVLGGFTTFSALALETGLLLDAGRVVVAVGYVAVTMIAGLAAVRVGQFAVEARR